MRSRRAGQTLALGLSLLAVVPASVAQTGKKPADTSTPAKETLKKPGSSPLDEAFATALADPDGRVAERALMAGWDKDAAWGEKAALDLLQGKSTTNRVLGAVALARKADPSRLPEIVKALKENDCPDERRVLVRAIGTRFAVASKDAKNEHKPDVDAVAKALEPFLSDRDAQVKAAALASYADLGDPKAVGKWMANLREIPAYSNSKSLGDAEIVNRAMYGSAYALSGVRPKKVSDVRDWFNTTKGAERAKAEGEPFTEAKSDQWNGATYYVSPGFDIYFRIAGVKGLPTDGQLEWTKLSKAFDAARRLASDRMTPIVGPVHSTHVRLYVADKQQFSALATTTTFAGVTQGNEIVLQLQTLPGMTATLVHEYVHWIHQSWFPNQPRWLAEGTAMSLADLRKDDDSRDLPPAGSELRKMMDAGIFSQMLNWNSGGSSDSKETARYMLAKMAIDFLRRGPFSVPEERLGFFMGRIDRREAGPRALELTYGLNVKQMDAAARAWYEAKASEPKPDK